MNPKFTGVWIPSEVLALNLSLTAKVAYGVVNGLDGDEGCFASNGYLAKTLGLSERQVRTVLKELEDAKLIHRVVSDNNRVIKTVEKVALVKALGEEVNFQRGRKKTSTGGGSKPPTYSKVDNKEDIIKKEYAQINELPFSSSEFLVAWNNWIDYRRDIKKPLRLMSINPQFELFKLWGEKDSIVAIRNSIANGWVGLFPIKKGYNQSQSKPLTAQDHNEF